MWLEGRNGERKEWFQMDILEGVSKFLLYSLAQEVKEQTFVFWFNAFI